MINKIYLLFLVFGAYSLFAAEKDFSSWQKYTQGELIRETNSVAPGATANLALKISLRPGWHTYWSNPGDSGTPLRIHFRNGPGVHVTRVMMPYPKRFETGPLITFGFEKEAIFPIEIELDGHVHTGQSVHVEADVEWLVCADVCIPATETLKSDLPVTTLEDVTPGADFASFQRVRQRVPRVVSDLPRTEETDQTVALDLGDLGADYDFVDYFPFRNGGTTNEAPIVKSEAGRLLLTLNKSNVKKAKADRFGVLVVRRKDGAAVEAREFGDSGWQFEETKAPPPAANFGWMLISAFIGGMILNLMPCVFPILSIKLLSLLKLGEAHPQEVRAQNLSYVVGVLVSFVAIALTLSLLRSAGTLVGWGFQLQSPVFLSVLVWLFFVLALNLFGTFELDLFDAGIGDRLTRMGGLAGSFFTGVLAVIVASPCTAPFMGVALGFGLSQSTPMLVAIFLSLGSGLAFPYIVFTVFPGMIRILPRPGMWMVRVKQVMAFPLLLTDIWLVWILGQVSGMDTVAIVLFGAVVLAFAYWLSAARHRVLARRLSTLLLAGSLGWIAYADRAPPAAAKGGDGMWQPFTKHRLEAERGQNVMVNMTADWCLTCKVNERLVFDDLEVQARLKRYHVVLLKGDWTQRNEEITLFLNRFERVGVPFYVLYSKKHPGGQPLPEVLGKNSFLEWVDQEYAGTPGEP